MGRPLQADHVLVHVFALLLVHLEVVTEVEERVKGLDCKVLDIGEDFLLHGSGNKAHMLEVLLKVLAAA